MKQTTIKIVLFTMPWIFFGGCAGSNSQIDLSGTWGGDHIGMMVSDSSATLEYDCAHGSIDEPIEPDDNGEFEMQGIYVFEHGQQFAPIDGPASNGENPDEHPALYKGRIDGKVMTLIVILTDTEKEVGSYSLTLGAVPNVNKCM
jgi:hypothetical protein